MSQADEAVSAWMRIVHWMTANTPAHADALNPPAAEEQIARAESEMAVSLPPELREVLMVNNGTTAKHRTLLENAVYDERGGGDYSPFPSDFIFCDLELMSSLYTANRKASIDMYAPGSRYEYWREGWIPVFRKKDVHCGLFLDVSGGQNPAPVQAYEEESFPELAFPSLADYLGTVADALEGIRPFTVMGRQAPHLPTVQEGLICW